MALIRQITYKGVNSTVNESQPSVRLNLACHSQGRILSLCCHDLEIDRRFLDSRRHQAGR